jgi:hypothetical protein
MNLHCTVQCHFRCTVTEEKRSQNSCFYLLKRLFSFCSESIVHFVFLIIVQETKAQFARDDPAFLVLLAAWLVISSVRSYQLQSPRDCFKY